MDNAPQDGRTSDSSPDDPQEKPGKADDPGQPASADAGAAADEPAIGLPMRRRFKKPANHSGPVYVDLKAGIPETPLDQVKRPPTEAASGLGGPVSDSGEAGTQAAPSEDSGAQEATGQSETATQPAADARESGTEEGAAGDPMVHIGFQRRRVPSGRRQEPVFVNLAIPSVPPAGSKARRFYRALPPPPKWMPIVAGCLIAAGVAGLWLFPYVWGEQAEELTEAASEPADALKTMEDSYTARVVKAREGLEKALSEGSVPKTFDPPEKLEWAPGRTLTVYCRLESPLDAATEKTWRGLGMLAEEGETLNILLRRVTVNGQEAADSLIDWHVGGIAVVAKPAEPEAEAK